VSEPVPPEAVIVADPLEPPLQATLVCDPMLAVMAVGCVMVTVFIEEQVFASVMVTV
jgi:hypothetical protein